HRNRGPAGDDRADPDRISRCYDRRHRDLDVPSALYAHRQTRRGRKLSCLLVRFLPEEDGAVPKVPPHSFGVLKKLAIKRAPRTISTNPAPSMFAESLPWS